MHQRVTAPVLALPQLYSSTLAGASNLHRSTLSLETPFLSIVQSRFADFDLVEIRGLIADE
jgi:hypothetical protein